MIFAVCRIAVFLWVESHFQHSAAFFINRIFYYFWSEKFHWNNDTQLSTIYDRRCCCIPYSIFVSNNACQLCSVHHAPSMKPILWTAFCEHKFEICMKPKKVVKKVRQIFTSTQCSPNGACENSFFLVFSVPFKWFNFVFCAIQLIHLPKFP